MVRKSSERNVRRLLAAAGLGLAAAGGAAQAQNIGSSASTWSGSWQFASPSQTSVQMQQADLIAKREAGQYRAFGPPVTHNVVTTHTDNRQNYIENVLEAGSELAGRVQIGDEIGQNTNSVGAMNTGATTVEISGSGNTVTALNTADSVGCQDSSINSASVRSRPGRGETSTASVLAQVTAPGGPGASVSAGSTQPNCGR